MNGLCEKEMDDDLLTCQLILKKSHKVTHWKGMAFYSVSGIVNSMVGYNHRLSINRPTKRGKEKSPSDRHCQCKKEMDNPLQACQQFLKQCHIVTRLLKSEHHF
jgi:hypothetical protein